MIDRDLPFPDYLRAAGINNSSFADIDPERDGCPALWHARHTGEAKREPETEPMTLGRAFHCLALTPDLFAKQYVVEDDALREKLFAQALASGSKAKAFSKNLAAYRQFKDECAREGREVISTAQADTLRAMVSTLDASPPVAAFFAEKPEVEVSMFAELADHQGRKIACKGRLDAALPGRKVLDLKTVASASPRAVGNFIARYKLHVQAAFYLDLTAAAGYGEVPSYGWAFVDKRPGAGRAVHYVADESMLKLGRQEYRGFLGDIINGFSTGKWPGHSEIVELPGWFESQLEEVS